MSRFDRVLTPSEAAGRLGVSAKALRLYEKRGLIAPLRTAAGWRAYGPADLRRAAEIKALRALGLGLDQVAGVLDGEARGRDAVLAAHQRLLEGRLRQLAGAMETLRGMRGDLRRGRAECDGGSVGRPGAPDGPRVAFALPWPWGGETFAFHDIPRLTYIVGPLGSGKTRFAMRLAESLPDAAFLGLDRLAEGGAAARARLDADPALASRVEEVLGRLAEEGATRSDALVALVAALEAEGPASLVIDMVEQGLDASAQATLIGHLRHRGPRDRRLFLLTRSCVVLDLDAVGPEEAILLCPANHSPPTRVAPHPGAPGYEAVATCLASPEVRARTAGVVAWRPQVA